RVRRCDDHEREDPDEEDRAHAGDGEQLGDAPGKRAADLDEHQPDHHRTSPVAAAAGGGGASIEPGSPVSWRKTASSVTCSGRSSATQMPAEPSTDRKSTRLNSSHVKI